MAALVIPSSSPPREYGSRVLQVVDDCLVQEFIVHKPVECVADAVLHWLARTMSCQSRLSEAEIDDYDYAFWESAIAMTGLSWRSPPHVRSSVYISLRSRLITRMGFVHVIFR